MSLVGKTLPTNWIFSVSTLAFRTHRWSRIHMPLGLGPRDPGVQTPGHLLDSHLYNRVELRDLPFRESPRTFKV